MTQLNMSMLDRLAKEVEVALKIEEQHLIEHEFYWVPSAHAELDLVC